MIDSDTSRVQLIELSGLLIPLPLSWSITSNGKSYSGEEGLLDPRVCEQESPIDQERVDIAMEELREHGASVRLATVNGCTSMCCEYKKQDCAMLMYSIDGKEKCTEVRLVYILRPGFEHLTDVIKSSIED